ncbi:riboflavin biosynthesis protein RibA [Solilutibacter pythonis]|uniref:riboflavin biosynthesis protein RibA n=1 Tax=Solilutibacter pythonis TaxID=2483112 RepID=UPI00131498F2|nr:riboflavin biosynthesis protein RibA [Lysobacter pythonis]
MNENARNTGGLVAEQASSKVAAVFSSLPVATEVARQLRQSLGLPDAQVRVIAPGEPNPGRKLQPESHGIFLTMIRAHAKLGIAGAVLGALLWLLLRALGVTLILTTGGITLAMFIVFGAVFGLLLAGLVTLRPDHDAYIVMVREAMGEGRSAVVVHALDHDQRDAARRFLEAQSGEVVSTL